MRYETNEELRESIAELTERMRAERVERGLMPEPPEPFIGETLSFALFEDMRSFRAIFAKYARLVTEGARPTIDLDKLAHYSEAARLANSSTDFHVKQFALGVKNGFSVMGRVNNGEDVSMIALSLILQFMSLENFYYDYQSSETYDGRRDRIMAEVAALKADEVRYAAEIEAAKKMREERYYGEE